MSERVKITPVVEWNGLVERGSVPLFKIASSEVNTFTAIVSNVDTGYCKDRFEVGLPPSPHEYIIKLAPDLQIRRDNNPCRTYYDKFETSPCFVVMGGDQGAQYQFMKLSEFEVLLVAEGDHSTPAECLGGRKVGEKWMIVRGADSPTLIAQLRLGEADPFSKLASVELVVVDGGFRSQALAVGVLLQRGIIDRMVHDSITVDHRHHHMQDDVLGSDHPPIGNTSYEIDGRWLP